MRVFDNLRDLAAQGPPESNALLRDKLVHHYFEFPETYNSIRHVYATMDWIQTNYPTSYRTLPTRGWFSDVNLGKCSGQVVALEYTPPRKKSITAMQNCKYYSWVILWQIHSISLWFNVMASRLVISFINWFKSTVSTNSTLNWHKPAGGGN